MSHNSFGHLFRVTTFGESHGPAIGCIVDGCPPGIELSVEDIQYLVDKRRPGQSRFTSQRRESDEVKILSGVFEGKTTGTPIALVIDNVDQRSRDYGDIKDMFRPGHADYTYQIKYGLRDYRGGGRASARETAVRVAAGAIARKIIPQVIVHGALVQIGPKTINRELWDWGQVECNDLFCPDAETVPLWEDYLDTIRKNGLSIGALVEVWAENVPAGWGAPLYGKLDAEIASGLMSINAVKGVEIGDGFASVLLTGETNADEIIWGEDGHPRFLSNHAGGILGGISTGQPIVARIAVKPTSSILTPRQSIDRYGRKVEISTKGRHDPCVGIRAVPVAEAMVACALADAFLRHRGQVGQTPDFPLTLPIDKDR